MYSTNFLKIVQPNPNFLMSGDNPNRLEIYRIQIYTCMDYEEAGTELPNLKQFKIYLLKQRKMPL